MTVTAYKLPGTTVDDSTIGSVAWTTPNNAQVNDTNYTTQSVNSTSFGHYLKCTNFGFTSSDVPVGATINGIEIQVGHKGTGTSHPSDDKSAKIVKGGVISGTDLKSITGWGTADEVFTYGGSANLWGLSWSQTDIVASTFGFAISTETNSANSSTSSINYVQIRVYYTVTGGIIESAPMNWEANLGGELA